MILGATQAASDANLTAFRETMNYDNLTASLNRTNQYEAAGAVFMVDPVVSDTVELSTGQIEGAMPAWSEEAYSLSSSTPQSRRAPFDVPLPARVVDRKVAQRQSADTLGVLMAEPLPLLAGRALVIARYAAMAWALRASNKERVMRLFNAALPVPIWMRLLPGGATIAAWRP